ncbi:ribosome biogenesis GTP-binding protein YlqF [compost metagenome]
MGRNAFDEEEVALELLDYLKSNYAEGLVARFKLTELDAATLADMKDEDVLDTIGRKRGALLGKGKVNLQKAAEIVMHEFRAGNLGRITLETPEEFAQWLAAGQRADAERAAKKAARGKKGKAKPEAPEADSGPTADA